MDPSFLQQRRSSQPQQQSHYRGGHVSLVNKTTADHSKSQRRRRRRKRPAQLKCRLFVLLVACSVVVVVVLIRGLGIVYHHLNNGSEEGRQESSVFGEKTELAAGITSSRQTKNATLSIATTVPFVYMVFDRVDYFRQSMESLLESDFTDSGAPLIISHDGRVPEMMEYVETLKRAHPTLQIMQLIHPYSCLERQRTNSVTCAKHHFTWLLQAVLGMEEYQAFLFLEEDYVVATTIYETVMSGLVLYHQRDTTTSNSHLFGITLDPINVLSVIMQRRLSDVWVESDFVSGPMVLTRDMIERFMHTPTAVHSYCTFNDYNWDWSIVHVQNERLLPHLTLAPSVAQVRHIGRVGMHHGAADSTGATIRDAAFAAPLEHPNRPLRPFHGTALYQQRGLLKSNNRHAMPPARHEQGFGGWNDTSDIEHCLEVQKWNERNQQ